MGYFIKNTKDRSFLIDDKDIIGLTIFNTGLWEPEVEEVYKKLVNLDYVVVNIGANIGYHAIKLADLSNRVIAFEPQNKIFNQLCANIHINDLDSKIDAFKLGLGEESKTIKMSSLEDNPSLLNRHGIMNNGGIAIKEDGTGEEVEIVTLDSFNLKVDLILMDVESYEFDVILGSIKTIKNNRPIIIFECWETERKTFFILKSLDYEIYTKPEFGYNYIAIHPDFFEYQSTKNKIEEDGFRILELQIHQI
jgi:FkbM family methyltransferase